MQILRPSSTLPQRWTVGAGGFLGEVTLQALSEQDGYVQKTRRCVELTNLFVHPLRRNQGWAETLVQTAMSWAQRNECDVFLRAIPYGVRPAKLGRLIQFYRRYEFRQVRRGDPRELVWRWRP